MIPVLFYYSILRTQEKEMEWENIHHCIDEPKSEQGRKSIKIIMFSNINT